MYGYNIFLSELFKSRTININCSPSLYFQTKRSCIKICAKAKEEALANINKDIETKNNELNDCVKQVDIKIQQLECIQQENEKLDKKLNTNSKKLKKVQEAYKRLQYTILIFMTMTIFITMLGIWSLK